eukprot:CAMPEP_0168316470 /NCGR_PEP_ID=MMETSP0210-20121227/15630_1 /TAXON_ID=40633 /ORGANISM="Condylostoma magnum, Strain COL2" /LENGTH=45 /DNA_ID= /DNA_START= /DNA_END= /DNA_ORIENTATION=
MTGPKNFMTTQLRKGGGNTTPGVTLGSYPGHMGDPYDNKQEMLRE